MKKLIITVLACIAVTVFTFPLSARAQATDSTTSGEADTQTIALIETPGNSQPTESTVSPPTETSESKQDTATISIIMSAITTIAAIVAPTVSAILTVKSNEKMKRLELHSPRVYDAVSHMISAHAHMPRYSDYLGNDQEEEQAFYSQVDSAFHEFESACYEVMALVPNLEIHQRMVTYLNFLEINLSYRIPEEEATFRGLITAITLETSPYTSNKEKTVVCQHKTTDSE